MATANAQTASNVATAQEQQRLNMVGTKGPDGSVSYQADPSQPGGYTQTTTLSPTQQGIYDASNQAQQGALNVANAQIGRVNDALGTPLSTEGLPTLHGGGQLNAGQGVQTSFNQGGPLQYSFDPGQAVQGQVGAQDLSAASQQAQNAAYQQAASRLDPQFAQQENQLRTQLANQGLSQDSDAYQTALANFNQGKNDAYSSAQNAAVTQGNAAAQQLFDQSLQQGQFANSAAAQMYGQNQGQAAFNNQTAGQDFTQNQQAAQFNNDAQNQTFNQDLARAQLANTARQQGLQERAYIQNQPINQFTSLLGSGQVQMPTGISYSPTQVANTDVLGAYALNQQGQIANAQLKAQSGGGLMGGLMNLGSAAIMASDRRLKTDVRLIRRRRDGLGVYAYRYRGDPMERVGVMAQEVKKVRPDLVVRRPDGFLAVSYAGLDLDAA